MTRQRLRLDPIWPVSPKGWEPLTYKINLYIFYRKVAYIKGITENVEQLRTFYQVLIQNTV